MWLRSHTAHRRYQHKQIYNEMKRLLLILSISFICITSNAASYTRNKVDLDLMRSRIWWTVLLNTGCPPDPYPQYPWYKAGSICNSAIGNNDLYAVFNIADSVLYRLSSGTVIVNTPGCPPLPNPWYPYDSNCNSTIGNNDIYAVWYVLHLIDSLLIINPPAPTPHGAYPYMAYFFSPTQIDSMPYKWVKSIGAIEIPNNDGFRAIGGRNIWRDANDTIQFRLDTAGVTVNDLFIATKFARNHSFIMGLQTGLAQYPNTGISDTTAEWQQQSLQVAGVTNYIFRNGINGWYVLLAKRSKKDTLATLSDIRASGGGSIGGSGTANFLPQWVTSSSLGNSPVFNNASNVGVGTTAPLAKLDVHGDFCLGDSGLAPQIKIRTIAFAHAINLVAERAGFNTMTFEIGASGFVSSIQTDAPALTFNTNIRLDAGGGLIYNNDGGIGITINGNASPTSFPQLFADPNGHSVGINTGSPSETLEVNGVALIDSTEKINTGNNTQAGSTSGTATFSQVESGKAYKKVVVYCGGLLGTASYTFPVAFAHTPAIISTNQVAAGVVTTLTTTGITLTGITTTGYIFIEGN